MAYRQQFQDDGQSKLSYANQKQLMPLKTKIGCQSLDCRGQKKIRKKIEKILLQKMLTEYGLTELSVPV